MMSVKSAISPTTFPSIAIVLAVCEEKTVVVNEADAITRKIIGPVNREECVEKFAKPVAEETLEILRAFEKW